MESEVMTRGGLLARGIFALIIGVLCFTIPIAMEALFAYIIGIFLIVISIVTGAVSISDTGKVHWGVLILSILGLIVAILLFMTPFVMFVALTILVAAWAIITGIAELALAFSLDELPFRIMLGIGGFFSVLFGILIGFAPLPMDGSLILIMLIGIYFLIMGILSLITGLLMRKGEVIVSV
ncbi:HdeD family acid-resistance protein [Methanocalculus sp. MC3]